MENKKLQNLINFMQTKGLIYGPEPEIYGGLAGFYTYGPLGKAIKNKIENLIRKEFIKEGFFEVECPTVMPKEVWEASGHLGGFTDPLVECSKCGSIFRADNLIEEFCPEIETHDLNKKQLLDAIKKNNLTCPNCKSKFKEEVKDHSLMMGTTIGVNKEAYNRPETATTTYLPFLRYYDFFRKKLPFSVFQIGKAYRNEISPRNHLLRCREFTQAEGQLFVNPEEKNNFKKFEEIKKTKLPLVPKKSKEMLISVEEALRKGHFKNRAYAWSVAFAYSLFKKLGIPEDRIRLRQHGDDEKAFYADDAWDIEIKLNSFGWTEMCGIHDRTDYDLKQHSKKSGLSLEAFDEETRKKFTPHILEIAFGSDRPFFAVCDLFYEEKEKGKGKTTFKIPYWLAGIEVAVFPLVKKLGKEAKEIFNRIKKTFFSVYDESGAIGRRYLRASELGIPFCITVDFETLEDGKVTVRDRDTEEQERVKIEELETYLRKRLKRKY